MRCIAAFLLTLFVTLQLAVTSFAQQSDVEGQAIEETLDIRAVDKENFDAAFRKLKNQDQLQFELAEAPPPPKLDWLERILEPVFKFFAALAPLFEIIFWVFVIGGIGLILYILGRALWNFRLARLAREKEEGEDTYLYQPSQEQARILLDAVDALAAKGLYAEAVHQLLFRSVQDIGIARPNMIRRSYTSREIATLSELTPKTREAFSLIAAEVERSHFGGRSLDEAAFQKCRAAYAQFAIPTRNEESLIIKNGVTA
jgi:hypothetical protein